MKNCLITIALIPLAFASGMAQAHVRQEASPSIASHVAPATPAFRGNTPSPGGARLQYEVEPIPQFCSRGDEIPGCKRAGQLYFYRSKRPARLGLPAPRKGKSSLRLYAAAGLSDGDNMLQELVSRQRLVSLSQMGLVWQAEEESFLVTASSHRREGKVTMRIAKSTCKEIVGVQETPLLLGAHPRESDFQPAVDPSGHIMVWTSDRAGGYGGTDLYWATWEDGKWSSPRNMGGWVNTAADEGYPAFNGGGSLFFASNGLPGFGGWDIHWTRLDSGDWQAPINAGGGINSPANDLSMIWNDPGDGNYGYFASDRVPQGGLDMYAFVRHPELWVTVQDAETQLPLREATLKLRESGLRWRSLSLDSTGQVVQRLGDGEEWDLEVQAEGYYPRHIHFSSSEFAQGQDRFQLVQLEPIRLIQFHGTVEDSLTGEGMQGLQWRITSLTTTDSISSGTTDAGALAIPLQVGQDYLMTFRQGDSCSQGHVIPLRRATGGATLTQQFRWSCGRHRSLVVVIRDSMGIPMAPSPHIVVLNAQGERLQSGTADTNGLMRASIPMKEALVQVLATQLNGSVVRVTTDPRLRENIPLHIPPAPKPDVPAHVLYFWGVGTDQVTGHQIAALQEIAFFMVQHPDYHLRAESHTDARGDAAINSELAHRRSHYILDQIEAIGPIDRSRLHQQDHGESAIANGCLDGVPCTEEQHLDNRRTEVYLYRPPQSDSLGPSRSPNP